MLINHKRCPECGTRIKPYYWYCGTCDNQNLNNWAMTGLLVLIALVILAVVAFYIKGLFCNAEMFHPFISQFGVMC